MVLGISDIPTILVIAGLVFIFIAIVRNISGYIETRIDEKTAKILGIVGIFIFGLGLITAAMEIFPPTETTATPTPASEGGEAIVFHTPTPTQLITPTPTIGSTSSNSVTPTSTPLALSVEITYPIEEVYTGNQNEAEVGGTISRALEEGEEYMWVALGFPGEWYPQENGPIDPSGLNWNTNIYIAGPSVGTKIKVAVLIVDGNLDSKLNDYIKEQGEWYDPYNNNTEIEENIKDSVTPVFKGHH